MVGKACGDAKLIAASAADPPPGGRFPDQARYFPDTTIYVPVRAQLIPCLIA
jgi:hypothetical protein